MAVYSTQQFLYRPLVSIKPPVASGRRYLPSPK